MGSSATMIVGGLTIAGSLGIMRLVAEFAPVHFFAQPVVTLVGLGIAMSLRAPRRLVTTWPAHLFGVLLLGAFVLQTWLVPVYSAVKASYLLPALLPAALLLAAVLFTQPVLAEGDADPVVVCEDVLPDGVLGPNPPHRRNIMGVELPGQISADRTPTVTPIITAEQPVPRHVNA